MAATTRPHLRRCLEIFVQAQVIGPQCSRKESVNCTVSMQSALVASTSGRCCSYHASPSKAAQLVGRPRIMCRASSTSSNEFAQRAQEFAASAQQKVQDFVKEQNLEEKAAAATKTAKEKFAAAYEETEQNVRRTYMKLESEHNISSRVEGVKKKVTETARDIDQEYSISRKLKTAYADAKRMWPTWRRQFSDFSQTQAGKTTLLVGFVVLLFSGLLWQLLNVFWLLWWVSIPVSLLVASQGKQTAGQAGAADSFTGGRWGSSSSSSNGFSSSYNSSSRSGSNSDGPVVDAEWVSLDDDDSSSNSSRRWRK